MKITAFIVEDISHSIKTLEILLQKYDEIELVGFATNAEEAIEKIKVLKPDVLFMDIKLGKDSGFTVLDQTKGFYKFVLYLFVQIYLPLNFNFSKNELSS